MEKTILDITKDLSALQSDVKQLHEVNTGLSTTLESLREEVREQQRVDDAHAERLAQICELISNLQHTFDDLALKLTRQTRYLMIMASLLIGMLMASLGIFNTDTFGAIAKKVFGL